MARAPGTDGVVAPSGYLLTIGEKNPRLAGSSRWVTYDNLLANVTIVASAVGIWLDLGGSAKWTAVPNPKGGREAVEAAELVQDGIINARMETRWRSVVKRQLVKKFRGFAMHAKGWRRDAAGRIVLAELGHRPQWSIDRWIKPTETALWSAVEQSTRTGATYPIARRDLFYSHEGALGDDPQGVGLFRHLVEVADIYKRYKQLQGIAFDTDINGVPLGRAPISELLALADREGVGADAATPEDKAAAINAFLVTQTKPLRDFIENRVVTPNRSLLLDSLPYFSTETDQSKKPSTTFQWSVETIRQQIGSIPELGRALNELNFEMARVLTCEWMLLGGDGSSGAYAASADKTSMFAMRIDGSLDDIGDDAERDIVPDLLARNGIVDERLWPTLQHEPIARLAVKDAATMLKDLAAAALRPGDPAENVLRARADLPPVAPLDEADDLEDADEEPDDADDGDDGAPAAGELAKAAAHRRGTRVRALVNRADGMKGAAGEVTRRRTKPPYYEVRFDDQARFPGVHRWLAHDELERERTR